MKLSSLLLTVTLFAAFTACNNNEYAAEASIESINIDNYPKVDGSTSTAPLQKLMACKLLGLRYEWRQHLESNSSWDIFPNYEDVPIDKRDEFFTKIYSFGTHNAYLNLIDKNADCILVARKMSDDEKSYAASKGVTLIETPVALDAFIFIVNASNSIQSLTTGQIQDIYTSRITNWNEVGGSDNAINPYARNSNSGSQELMESLVMKNLNMSDFPHEIENSMMGAFVRLIEDDFGLCYTVYYYKEQMIRESRVKHIAVDGVYPDKNTVADKSYPYTIEIYAVIRSDLDTTSMAYKLYEFIQSETGKNIIAESGYVANR
jgi:phosphate transport system substrate-binding protein